MKVEFLKDHDCYKAGAKKDLPDTLANYLIHVRVAKEVEPYSENSLIEVVDNEKVEIADNNEKKEVLPLKKKKIIK